MKITRKVHNKLYSNRYLRFYKHSTTFFNNKSSEYELHCFYDKWFILLSALPVLIFSLITSGIHGVVETYELMMKYYNEPYSKDTLSDKDISLLNKYNNRST